MTRSVQATGRPARASSDPANDEPLPPPPASSAGAVTLGPVPRHQLAFPPEQIKTTCRADIPTHIRRRLSPPLAAFISPQHQYEYGFPSRRFAAGAVHRYRAWRLQAAGGHAAERGSRAASRAAHKSGGAPGAQGWSPAGRSGAGGVVQVSCLPSTVCGGNLRMSRSALYSRGRNMNLNGEKRCDALSPLPRFVPGASSERW